MLVSLKGSVKLFTSVTMLEGNTNAQIKCRIGSM